MRHRTHSTTWQGQAFHFECLESKTGASDQPQWAVSRWREFIGREFIGMMGCSLEVTTKDFDVRCLHWLAELLSRPQQESAGQRHRDI